MFEIAEIITCDVLWSTELYSIYLCLCMDGHSCGLYIKAFGDSLGKGQNPSSLDYL